MRKGLGAGQGRGYKNIVPLDPYIHSLSARGVKSAQELYAEGKLKFGIIPTKEKEGLIREIARKVHDGVDWAIQWEREHLPQQRRWVRKEYERAKEQLRKGAEAIKKKFDKDDVRDELDTNDDGVQDIEYEELQEVNAEITDQLEGIDLDNNNIPDYAESDVKMEEDKISFPIPTPTPKETFGTKVRKGWGKIVEKEQEFVQKRREQKEVLNKLSDAQLREKAVRNPSGIFGGNIYEKEYLRRQGKRLEMQEKVSTTRQKAREDIKKGKTGGGLGIDVSFLNPLSAFSSKKK